MTKIEFTSLEGFERRSERMQLNYKKSVLATNKVAKEVEQSFLFHKEAVKMALKMMRNGESAALADCTDEERVLLENLLEFYQQALAVLGRLRGDEVGLRKSKSGRHSTFFILQYLYAYCKQYKQKIETTTKKAEKATK